MRGTIKMWNDKRGFGFIRRNDGDDVFVHATAVHGVHEDPPFVGDSVEFEIETSPRTGRPQACSVYLRRGGKNAE